MARQSVIGELAEDTPTCLMVETVWLFDRSDDRWQQGVPR